MARLPRISPVGLPVHLIQRGNNRQSCFGALEDYSAYMGWLKEYSKQYAVDIHAWVLDKSCSLTLYAAAGGSDEPNDAIARTSLCAIFQLSVLKKRYALGRTLQIMLGSK